MADPLQEEVEKLKANIATHKKKFYLIGAGVIIVVCIILYFMWRGANEKDKQIQAFTVKMALRDKDVKDRDVKIESFISDMKAKDAALAQARDSINKAYQQLTIINETQIKNHEKQKKDNATLSRLSLPDKIKFITGGSN